jgi:hypothetical protein
MIAQRLMMMDLASFQRSRLVHFALMVKTVQDKQADTAAFAALSEEDRNSRPSVLQEAESRGPSSMAFANNMVSFLKLVSSEKEFIPIFVKSFLVDRLAGMMNNTPSHLTEKLKKSVNRVSSFA